MTPEERQERIDLINAGYLHDISTGRIKHHDPKSLIRKYGDMGAMMGKPPNKYTFRDHYTYYSGKPPWKHMSDKDKDTEIARHLKIYRRSAALGAGLALAKLAYDGFKGAMS